MRVMGFADQAGVVRRHQGRSQPGGGQQPHLQRHLLLQQQGVLQILVAEQTCEIQSINILLHLTWLLLNIQSINTLHHLNSLLLNIQSIYYLTWSHFFLKSINNQYITSPTAADPNFLVNQVLSPISWFVEQRQIPTIFTVDHCKCPRPLPYRE